MRFRLFAGIALDERARSSCGSVAERLRSSGVRGRFEYPEKYHLTVAFLGPVEAEQVSDVTETMQRITSTHASFQIMLDKVGAFPNERAPRIVYVGSRNAGEAFRALTRDVREAYERLGFLFHQDAVAHVTLARVTKADRAVLPMLDVEPIPVRVSELTLFESLPDSEIHTTRYEVRALAKLT